MQPNMTMLSVCMGQVVIETGEVEVRQMEVRELQALLTEAESLTRSDTAPPADLDKALVKARTTPLLHHMLLQLP